MTQRKKRFPQSDCSGHVDVVLWMFAQILLQMGLLCLLITTSIDTPKIQAGKPCVCHIYDLQKPFLKFSVHKALGLTWLTVADKE